MLKSLYSRHNEIFLQMLRGRRESLQLRQRDLAQRVGRGQATVSKVESGTRQLDVIELRAWLMALGTDFVAFMQELDERLRAHPIPDARFRVNGRAGVSHRSATSSGQRRKPPPNGRE